MELVPLSACVFFLGCYFSGRLARLILKLHRQGSKTPPTRRVEQPRVQLMSLAEWLGEGSHDKTGR